MKKIFTYLCSKIKGLLEDDYIYYHCPRCNCLAEIKQERTFNQCYHCGQYHTVSHTANTHGSKTTVTALDKENKELSHG